MKFEWTQSSDWARFNIETWPVIVLNKFNIFPSTLFFVVEVEV